MTLEPSLVLLKDQTVLEAAVEVEKGGFNRTLRSRRVSPDHLFLLIGDHTRSHEEERQSCTSGHVQVQIVSLWSRPIFGATFLLIRFSFVFSKKGEKKMVLASNKQDLRGPEETHQHRHLEDSIL